MTPRGYILLALVLIGLACALIALLRSPASDPMRTASQRQIERDTAAIQRQVPDAQARPAETANVRSLCRERARQDARHQARMQDLDGTEPVNPLPRGRPLPRLVGYCPGRNAHRDRSREIAHQSIQPLRNSNGKL